MVSRSRISPISTTSGSCRRMYLSARLNDWLSAPTSRWLTTQPLCGCRNSMGSSTVTMCSRCSVLMLVDHRGQGRRLARAGGPGDQHQAARLLAQLGDHRRQPQLRRAGRILNGTIRKAPATAPRCMKMLARNRARFLTPKREVELLVLLEPHLLRVGQDRVAQLLGLDRRQRRRSCSGTRSPSMRSCGGDAGGDVQVRCALVDHGLEQLVQGELHAVEWGAGGAAPAVSRRRWCAGPLRAWSRPRGSC